VASAKKKKKLCSLYSWLAGKAFKEGDDEKGRKMYHKLARLGCKNTVELDGLKKKHRGRRKRGSKRR
jgi:hypothetical protein